MAYVEKKYSLTCNYSAYYSDGCLFNINQVHNPDIEFTSVYHEKATVI